MRILIICFWFLTYFRSFLPSKFCIEHILKIELKNDQDEKSDVLNIANGISNELSCKSAGVGKNHRLGWV